VADDFKINKLKRILPVGSDYFIKLLDGSKLFELLGLGNKARPGEKL
jgi:hypothetical protein